MFERKIPVLDSVARETEFIVDGHTYRLRYGFQAIAGFEEGTGINPAIQPVPPTIFNLMCLLYAGLSEHHPEVKIDQVKAWFNEATSQHLCKIAWESFFGTLPEPKPEADQETQPTDPPSA